MSLNKTEQAALIYGASLIGAAALSYWRGERDPADLLRDALIHGGIVGTGLTVIFVLHEDYRQVRNNGKRGEVEGQEFCQPFGKVAQGALGVLSAVTPLLASGRAGTFAVAPEDPKNLYNVVLPEG